MNKQQHALWAKTLLPLLLLLITGTVSAQTNYVFMNGTVFLCNNNGTLSTTTTFGENCIWVASGALNNSSTQTIYSYIEPTKYLNGSANNTAVTLGTSSQVWRSNDNGLCTYGKLNRTNYYFYAYFNGTNCSTSNNTTTRFTPYTVTFSTVAQQGTLPTITPNTATILLDGTENF